MQRFSQRMGLSPIRDTVQRDSMDDALRNRLWNAFHMAFVDKSEGSFMDKGHPADNFFYGLWHDFLSWPIDTIPEYHKNGFGVIRDWYMAADWSGVMDFVEYLVKEPEDTFPGQCEYLGSPSLFIKLCNEVLEREMSAWRIAEKQIVEITDEGELAALEEAMTQSGPWSVVGEHIKKATGLLFNREKPDYPNAVKEAISAVESACRVIAGDKKATLGQALKVIEKKHPLDTALKKVFNILYGDASNKGGIRHGGIEIAHVSFEEAKFMLIACSASVNYLKGISAEAN